MVSAGCSCQILTKTGRCEQSLVKGSCAKFQKNLLGGSRDVPCGHKNVQTDRHSEAIGQHLCSFNITYEVWSRFVPTLYCAYMRTDIREVFFQDNFLISLRNARKISTVTQIRFQNAAIPFVS
jgi:hypothetical protein